MAMGPLTLSVFPDVFAICRLPPDAALPNWAHAESFVSITCTRDELSIVCPQSHVPDGIRAETDWRCLKVEGPLDLDLTGILASLIGPLATAGISSFTVATYDTDYVLVKNQDIVRATEVLEQAGHHVRRRPETPAGAPRAGERMSHQASIEADEAHSLIQEGPISWNSAQIGK